MKIVVKYGKQEVAAVVKKTADARFIFERVRQKMELEGTADEYEFETDGVKMPTSTSGAKVQVGKDAVVVI